MTAQPPPRFGLFVEGSHYSSLRGLDALVELWHSLAEQHGVTPERVDVQAFHKGQVELMAETRALEYAGVPPLDAVISKAHADSPFDILIVAIDALPENNELRDEKGCLAEMRWMFERFVAREILPQPFLEDTHQLLEHYAQDPRPPRTRNHYPRIDAVFMEPEFEALVVSDEGLVKIALEVEDPDEWPSFKNRPPKAILEAAVEAAGPRVRRRVRGDIKSNRHAWALEIVRKAAGRTRFAKHNIMQRLQAVLHHA
jgi:hypothetical protein